MYGAALLVGSPIFGWIADHTESRRLPLVLSLLLLGASTILLAVGKDVALYMAGRILQGLSSSVVWSVGCALLVDTVGPKEIGEAMGYVTLAMTLGLIFAPLFGGIVYQRSGYYAVFAMGFALVAVDVIFRTVLVERKIAARYDSSTPDTAATEVPSVAPVCASEVSRLPGQGVIRHFSHARDPIQHGNQSVDTQLSRRNTQISLADEEALSSTVKDFVQSHSHHLHLALKHHEEAAHAAQTSRNRTIPQRIRARLPPFITLLASRRLLSALWGCLIQATIMTSFDSTLPLYVKTTFGWDSVGGGLIFLPIVVPTLISPYIGGVSDRYGPRYLASAGFITALPSLVCLRFIKDDSLSHKVLLCVLLAFVGLSLTLAFPPLMAEITYVIASKEAASPGIFGTKGAYAQAYALFNVAFAGGCLIGPVWGGFVSERSGFGTMGWSLGVLSAVTALPTLIWAGGSIFKVRRLQKARHLRTLGTTPEGLSALGSARPSEEACGTGNRNGPNRAASSGAIDWSEKTQGAGEYADGAVTVNGGALTAVSAEEETCGPSCIEKLRSERKSQIGVEQFVYIRNAIEGSTLSGQDRGQPERGRGMLAAGNIPWKEFR